MDKADFKKLQVGDVIEGRSSGITYVVTENRGDRVTAVRTVEATNPEEWNLVVKITGWRRVPLYGDPQKLDPAPHK